MEEPPKKVRVIETVQSKTVQSESLSMKDEILYLITKQINLIERNKKNRSNHHLYVSYYNEINRKLKILQLSPDDQKKFNLLFDDVVLNKYQYEINLEFILKKILDVNKEHYDIGSEQILLNNEVFEANKRHNLFMLSYFKVRNHILKRYLYTPLIVSIPTTNAITIPSLNFVNIL